MLSFLSLRGYLIAGFVSVLLAAFGWYTYHERHVEHVKDVAAETRVVNSVKAQDVVITATAVKDTNDAIQIYKQIVQLPSVPDIGIMCHAASSGPVPPAASAGSGGHPSPDSGAADLSDPSGSLLTIGRSADALVRKLQAENAALRIEMLSAAKVHQ